MTPRAAALAALLFAALPARAAPIDYLYIEANEGGSSGGHVALGLGDEVWHFQQDAGGLLRLRRDPRPAFRIRYALLENRPVHLTRLAVDEPAATAVRQAFAERLLREDAEDRRQAALDADVALFALAGRPPAEIAWPVPAAGYFAAAGDGPPSPGLRALRDRYVEARGADALPRRIAETRRALAALSLAAAPAGDGPAAAAPTASTRLAELLEQLTALEILAAAPPLHADALLAADPPLADGERAALRRWAATAADGLAALPDSSRPDWGYALLLGMARLEAVDASLASGRLLVLDAWPADAPRPPLPSDAQAAFFAALDDHTRLTLERRRAQCLAAADCREAGYARLETAVNRAAEVRAARAAALPPRVAADPLLLRRPAARGDLVASLPSGAAAERERVAAVAVAARHHQQVRAWRGYDLITRNCVTELFAVAESAAGDRGGDRRVAQRATLGSSVGGAPWNAIPFVAAAGVGASGTVVARETWPSFRQATLRARQAREADLAAWWAEATVSTARGYRPGVEDSTFLFFTDDALATRPLLGAANLLAATAASAVGLVTAPFDGGRRLAAGARGALFSLPELGFVNIRKGTTAWLTVDELERAGGLRDLP